MRPTFLTRLVNGPLFDPIVYVRLLNQRSALLFDCGRIGSIANREILSLDAVFISHPHMDHFMGLDQVLRIILHRDKPVHIYGPEGITGKVISRLGSYAWNLTREYPLEVIIHEVGEHDIHTTAARAHEGFRPSRTDSVVREGSSIASHPRYCVDAVILDHNIACLGYVLKEPLHINIRGDVIKEQGYQTGPWIGVLKEHILTGRLREHISFQTVGGLKESSVMDLMDELVITSPGQKIGYITDIRYSQENIERVLSIASEADVLFIEAYYLHERGSQAYEKAHLTAAQAGMIARQLNAKKVVPMHISPRYHDRAEEIYREMKSI
jgi:ribonuclease Z